MHTTGSVKDSYCLRKCRYLENGQSEVRHMKRNRGRGLDVEDWNARDDGEWIEEKFRIGR